MCIFTIFNQHLVSESQEPSDMVAWKLILTKTLKRKYLEDFFFPSAKLLFLFLGLYFHIVRLGYLSQMESDEI